MNSAAETRAAIHSRQTTAEETTRAALARAESLNPKLNAFLQIFPDHALDQARAVDARLARGEHPPLAGVPVALKDNICLAHGKTTCASRMLANYHSPFTATAAQRLIDAGAVILGKTNLDEFAMGSSTEHSAFGPTRNPWDLSRVPGGSSGGSAAAAAARICPIALGSDTGGSIRQPAGFCGVVGLKPTYGRVSRHGLVAYASSLDQIGPLATNVCDAALALNAIAGPDPLDSTSADQPATDFAADLETPVRHLTLGVPRQARSDANHPAVAQALDDTIRLYRDLGATILDIDLPMIDVAIAAYYIIALAEASSNLARFDGIRYGHRATLAPGEGLADLYCKTRSEGFGPEVKRRIMLGTHVLSSGYYDAYYTTALRARRKILADFNAAFDRGCQAILLPSSPSPAFKIGEKTSDPLALYLEDVYTVAVNLAGLPALTFPTALASLEGAKLPIGMQLIGRPFDESALLRIARQHERERGGYQAPSQREGVGERV
jgi:aspartyl-tRNA(Asn)/glutamyl-tRNA(Gln) amidotransferase subunit A